MKRDDESCEEAAPRREPNGDNNCDRVASLSTRTRAVTGTSQSATGSPVDFDLSLPTAVDGAAAAAAAAAESLVLVRRPQRAGGCHGFHKPYRDIVPTQVYTLPYREGVPVRLSTPLRPPTAGQQQLRHHRAYAVGVKSQSARSSTHPSRAQSRTFGSKRPAGRCHYLGVRIASVPPATQQQQQQLDDDPSATNTSSSKKAGQLSAAPYNSNKTRIVGGVRSAAKQQQLDTDPSAMSTRSSRKAGQLSATTTAYHPNRTRIIGGVRSHVENDPCRHQAPTSANPSKTRIIGGVRSHVENDPCDHHPPKAPFTAQSSARQRRHPETFLTVQARDIFLTVQAQARDTTKRWKVAAPRPPLKPRPLSAPARGRAIRCAVDRCCHSLPATSELSYGGTRFLRQWDGASRRQRGEILKALAEQLLVVGGAGGGSNGEKLVGGQAGGSYDDDEQQQQQQPSVLVDVQSSNEVIIKRTEGARREHPSGRQVIKLETAGTPSVEFTSLSPACSVLGDNSGTTFKVIDSTSTKNIRPRYHCWGYQAGATARPGGAIETADDYANGTGFLELLGAHAGLLVARISSYLRTLHSCGHAIGICLRVTTLLAEATFETARGGDRGGSRGSGSGSGSGGSRSGSDNYSIATSLAEQLSTPGIIRVALEIVAIETIVASKSAAIPSSKPEATPEPKPASNLASKPKAEPEAKPATKPASEPATKPEAKTVDMAEPDTTRKGATTRTPSTPREEESNRAQALRLLLAMVRAGGRQIKEHLTCSSSMLIPGADRSGDVLGPILVALRRSGCTVETRKAAGTLLVELGVGNPAGSGRVWNAILCILRQAEGGREAQVLGCDVARKLLSTLGAGFCSTRAGYNQSGFMWSQEHRLRPEVLLVPSALTLSLRYCSATREAARELVAFLANFSDPCCYLLVDGLVGVLGTISGVTRSPPLYWRRRHYPSSRREATTGSRDEDKLGVRCEATTTTSHDESELEVRWSEFHQPNHQPVAEISGQRSTTYRLNKAGFFCEVDYESPSGTDNSQQCDTDSVFDGGNEIAAGAKADSGQSATSESENCFYGKPTRSAAGSTDGDTHAIRAMEMLRRMCYGRWGADVCLVLLSTLAPLAVLDLVVGPGLIAESSSCIEENEKFAADVAGESAFITQARTTPDDCATRTATDGCASFPREEEEIQTEEARSGGTKKCHRRHHGASHLHRGIEDDFIVQDGRAIPDQSETGPRHAYFFAVAETLLAMYHLGGGCFFPTTTPDQVMPTTENTPGNATPKTPPFPPDSIDDSTPEKEDQKRGALSSEVLELKRMIDAALDGCRTLSSSLRNGDTTALTRIFSASADDCHADCEEIAALRRNVLALTKRLRGARPRPPAGDRSEKLRQDGLPGAYEEGRSGLLSITGG